jgi:hypothetical protein
VNKCIGCNDSGIMWLQPGNIQAPCLMCSASRNLNDIERELKEKICSEELFRTRLAIQQHNKRIRSEK